MRRKKVTETPPPDIPVVTVQIANKICHRAIPTSFTCVKQDCALWSEEHEACADLVRAEALAAMIESADGVVTALDALRQPFSIIAFLFESAKKQTS